MLFPLEQAGGPLAAFGDDAWDWLTPAVLAAVILLSGILVAAVRRHYRRADDALSTSDQMAHFRALYEKGELSQEEFDRVRRRLGARLRSEVQGPAAAPKPQQAPPPPDEPRLPPAPPEPPPPADGIRPA